MSVKRRCTQMFRRCAGALLPLGALIALDGCMVGPDFQKPEVKTAASFGRTNDPRAPRTAADSSWWKAFDDRTLDHLVELAYRQNLSLQIAGLRIVEARARLGLVAGRQYPQLQALFGSATATRLSEHGPNGARLDNEFVDFQVGFDAAWELDFWGKYRRGVQAEAANLLGTVGDYYSAIVSLTAEVARTYVMIRTSEVLLAQARENVALQQSAFDIADSHFRNGAKSELDPTQAKVLLESTRASIPQLEITLQQTENALGTLLGQPPGRLDALLAGPKEIPKAPPRAAIGVPAEMLRRRADIRSAEFYAASQCARIGVAKAELYPSFSLVGTIGLQSSVGGGPGSSANLFSPNSLFYGFGPRVNWPILNYGRLKNAVRIEDARFQQLLVAYRETVIRAAQEVEDGLAGFLRSQEAIAFAENAVMAAERSVELSLAQYREGTVDYQRVNDAQRSLLSEQNNLAQARSSVATNMIALYKALGGGWELREGQPVVPKATQRQMKKRTDWGDLLSTRGTKRPTRSQSARTR